MARYIAQMLTFQNGVMEEYPFADPTDLESLVMSFKEDRTSIRAVNPLQIPWKGYTRLLICTNPLGTLYYALKLLK